MKVGELIVKIGANISDLKRGVKEAQKEVASLPEEKTIHVDIDIDKSAVKSLRSSNTLLKALAYIAPIAATGIVDSAGALGGLVSMLGTATAGTLGFGAAAVSVLNNVFDAQKNIEKAQDDYAKALNTDEQQTALENLQQAYMGLNDGQLTALASLTKFRSFWKDFANSFQPSIITGFANALDGLRFLLENVKPAIQAAGAAFVGIISKMNDAMKNADFQKFFQWLGTSGGSAITTFGDIAITVLQGVMNLMVAFQPVSDAMQGGLMGMAQAFLQWTQSLASSDEFKDFLTFVIQTGPTFITLIKLVSVALIDLIRWLAPLGDAMTRVINVVLAFWNALIGVGRSTETTKARIADLTNAIKQLLGFQTASAAQASDVSDLDKAYQDMLDSIGGVGGELKGAGKAAQKFLASFDEIYAVPDQLDSVGAALPKPTLPPSSGGGGSTPTVPTEPPNNGGEDGGWIDKLIKKIKEIPALITLPDFTWPTAPAVVTDALQSIINKMNQFSTATITPALSFSLMLNAMQVSLNTYSPYLAYGFYLVTQSMGSIVLESPIVSASFADMLNTMQSNLNSYQPYISYGLFLVVQSMLGIEVQSPITSTAFSTMLNTMQVDLNSYQPYISWGLALIGLSMTDLTPLMDNLKVNWHNMLDSMQSQVNAYEPYISYGVALIGVSIAALINGANASIPSWQSAWQGIYNISASFVKPIIELFDSVSRAYQRLMDMLDKPIKMPNIQLPSFEMPKIATDITDALKNLDYGQVLGDAANALWKKPLDNLSTNPLSTFMGEHPELAAGAGAGAGIGGAAAGVGAKAKSVMEAIKEWMESIGGGAVPAYAGGGIVGSEQIARIGEGNKREAVIPLESGAMNPFADAVAARIGGSEGSSGGREVYIGVFDNSMLKQLERQLKIIRLGEESRGLSTL